MFMKRKLFAMLLLSAFSVSILAGCTGTKKEEETKDNVLKVAATVFPVYDMARTIGGDHVQVDMIVPPGVDLHSFEMTPESIKKIENADIVLYSGDKLDPWIAKIHAESEKKGKPRFVNVADGINILSEEDVEKCSALEDEHDKAETTHEHDHDKAEAAHEHDHDKTEATHEHEHDKAGEEHHHHHHEGGDPHIWTSLKNAQIMAANITKALTSANEKNKETFEKNGKEYEKQLADLDKQYQDTIDKAKRKTLFVADEFPFGYFVRDYNLQYVAAFDSCDDNAEPSAQRIAKIENMIKEQKVPVVFYTEVAEPKIATKIAADTGTKTKLFNAAHTVSADELKKGRSYLEIMKENLKSLEAGIM